jgi:Fe2+ transport system protein B
VKIAKEGAKMKAIIKDVLSGLLIFVLIMVLEFAVTLPFGEPSNESGDLAVYLNREFLLTAIPAAILTYTAAMVTKVPTIVSAYRKSIIWTVVVLGLYTIIAVGNDNVGPIFGSYGFYLLLLGVFIGPILYAKFKKLT